MNFKTDKNSFFDKSVYGFLILFLATLSISIFVNQIGYYGALALLLYRFVKDRKSPFSKNGLEWYFLLYIVAEIASTIFSVNKGQSFHNLEKRFLLIPIVYTIIASANDFTKAKNFLKVYLGFALLSIVLYLAFAARYYFYNLYQLEQSGPGIYQYPITTSELMSFTTIILFSFFIDEKNKLKNRLWSLLGFALAFIAMIATYKRTGWIGAAAGIITIIIIKRKWFLFAPIVLAFLLMLIFEKEKSEVFIYKTDNALQEVNSIKTAGRAYDVMNDKKGFWLADYENGIVKYENGKVVNKVATPSPVQKLIDVDDSLLLVNLIDTRFVLYKKGNSNLQFVQEMASPGFTISYSANSRALFVLDKDSGLTVFPKFKTDTAAVRLPQFAGYESVFSDSNYVILYSQKNGIDVYTLKESLPYKNVLNQKFDNEVAYIDYLDNNLFVEDKSSFKVFKLENDKLTQRLDNKEIKGIIQRDKNDSALFLMSNKGKIFKVQYPLNSTVNILAEYQLNYLPLSFMNSGNFIYATKLKNSRIASIFDRYNPSNYTRIALWRAGFKIFKEHPIVGVGDIDLAELYKEKKHFYDKEIQGHMHNNYVHILVTLGLFGFVAVMALLVKLFLLNYKIFKTLEQQVFSSSFAAGVVGCFVSFLAAGLTEWNFGDHEVITMIWFLTGLNIAFYKLYTKKIKLH